MKQGVIYPSSAGSLSLGQSNRHWSLSQARWPIALFSHFQSLASPFHSYLGKALTPNTAAMSKPSACGPLLCEHVTVWVSQRVHTKLRCAHTCIQAPIDRLVFLRLLSSQKGEFIWVWTAVLQQNVASMGVDKVDDLVNFLLITIPCFTAQLQRTTLQLHGSESIWWLFESDYGEINDFHCCSKMDRGVFKLFSTPLL